MRKSAVVLSLLALGSALAGAGSCQPPPLSPQPGLPEYQQRLLVPVPGGAVNAAGNNLRVMREDLSLDTRIGGYSLGAVYDAAAAGWLWSFQMTYDGATLLDASGARFSTAGLGPGDAIPGTWWVVLGPDAVKTKGGLVHRFGVDGRLETVHWSSDPYPRIEVRSKLEKEEMRISQLEQCTAPGACARIVRVKYDDAGHLEELSDPAGRRAFFVWDAEGRLVEARDALDLARGWPGFRYEYEGSVLRASTNSEGERVEFSHAGSVLEVRAIGEEDPTWRFERLSPQSGTFRTRVIDPLGHVTTLHYDAARRLLAAVDPLGEATEWAWEGSRPVRRTLPDGSTTTWVVADDDVVLELQPAGNRVQIQYAHDAVNLAAPQRRPLLHVEDDLGLLEERTYDAAGRLVARTDGAGDTTFLAYAAEGELMEVTHPDGSTLGLADYGEHGLPQTLLVDGTAYARIYDSVGNLMQRAAVEPDQPGVLSREYDANRNVSTIWLAQQYQGVFLAGQGIQIERRSDGRRLSVTRPGPAAAYMYDAVGRLIERSDEVGGAWRSTRFEWDAAGRLTAVELPNTLREERAYDEVGRAVLRVFGRGVPFAPEMAAAYTWQDGRLIELWDGAHAAPERYMYDAFGRLAQVIYPQGETLVPAWDARGRLTSLALADGPAFAVQLGLAYDGAGRETGLWLDGAPLEERSLAAGRLAEVRHGNGLVRTFARESVFERSSETRDAGGTVVAQTRLAEAAEGAALVCLDLEVEAFVGVLQQVSERHCLGGARRLTDGSESWDGLGNPLLWGPGSGFVYGPDLALLEEGAGHSYAYDQAGFAMDRDGESLAYDTAGRPAGVGTDHVLAWDAHGRPVSETTPQATILRRFGGLVEADAAGAPRTLDLGAVRVDLVAGDHRFRYFDPRGNVAFVTDPAGGVRTVYGYGAFGVAEVHGADDDPVRFARGRQVGDLVLLGQRLLDPAVGRFLSPDPIYQLQSQYTYAWGDPLFFWDPSGFEGTLHGLAAGQWTAVFTGAGAATLVVGLMGGPASTAAAATPSVFAFFVASQFNMIAESGGFPWEGNRTVGDLLGGGRRATGERGGPSSGAYQGVPGTLDLTLPAVAAPPNVMNTFRPNPEGGDDWGPRIRFPGGVSFSICAPTRVEGGTTARGLLALMGFNLVSGLALVWRARKGTRP